MSKLTWTEESLNRLDRRFLSKVRDRMLINDQTVVRFGEMGVVREKPNYEITYPNGVKVPVRGSNHKHYGETDSFDEGNLSPPFTLAMINKAYGRS